jgi:hypothetical protein
MTTPSFLLLSTYQSHDSFAVRQLLDHIRDSYWGYYLSGGAGTILSRMLYRQLCTYVRNTPANLVSCHWCADISLGMWIKRVGGQLFHHPDFHADIYDPLKDGLQQAITYHHLKEWNDYEAMIRSLKIEKPNE